MQTKDVKLSEVLKDWKEEKRYGRLTLKYEHGKVVNVEQNLNSRVDSNEVLYQQNRRNL